MPIVVPSLDTIAKDFAVALKSVDSRRPQGRGRGDRVYQAGIGPLSEEYAVRLVVTELRETHPDAYGGLRTRVPYPESRQTCDLCLGSPVSWAIEIKMARPSGDNGKPDPSWTKDILSPYDEDRGVIADCRKLTRSGFPGRKAVLIYGFHDELRPLGAIIRALELLAAADVELGARHEADFGELVHPVHRSGKVLAWEVLREL